MASVSVCANACGKPATVVCIQCSHGIRLCEACFGVIHAFPALRSHALYPPSRVCAQHLKPLNVRCVDCSIVVCIDCVINEHQAHVRKLDESLTV
jgi:hypothetical protein